VGIQIVGDAKDVGDALESTREGYAAGNNA
jgi:hypothetical protein